MFQTITYEVKFWWHFCVLEDCFSSLNFNWEITFSAKMRGVWKIDYGKSSNECRDVQSRWGVAGEENTWIWRKDSQEAKMGSVWRLRRTLIAAFQAEPGSRLISRHCTTIRKLYSQKHGKTKRSPSHEDTSGSHFCSGCWRNVLSSYR